MMEPFPDDVLSAKAHVAAPELLNYNELTFPDISPFPPLSFNVHI